MPPELAARPFAWAAGERLLGGLQAQLQLAREGFRYSGILARGAGCGAALALAEQLPVDRLALIEPPEALHTFPRPGPRAPGDPALSKRRRQVRRLNAFARRNLSLCVADVLVAEKPDAAFARRLWEGGLRDHSRVVRLAIPGEIGRVLYTNCENMAKRAIIDFLRAGVLPKELAQNPEMCIIYG